ncbi:hypothetical protein DFLDMN_006412 (plasmid) [Cupriavidus sp. H19C3]|uniref:hypothetical protein n=1 Tax=Cupriavidus sp. H19C3 TaxID=3241603 RepID=UPI003BF7C0CE
MRAAIDRAVDERDPGIATQAGEQFMSPAGSPMVSPYHRRFAYAFEDGTSSVTFTYGMRNRSTPMREEDDRHDFLLLLKVDDVDQDKHYRLFHGVA